MPTLSHGLRALWRDESGATAVEYAILASLIAAAIVVAVTTLGQRTANSYNNVIPYIGK